MFKDRKSRRIEFIYERHCRIYVYQVVVGKVFPVELLKQVLQIAVKDTSLMWIFTVTQGLCLLFTMFEYGNGSVLIEIMKNGGVVMGRYVECPLGEVPAMLQERVAFIFTKNIGQPPIVGFGGDNDHVIKILGCCSDEGYAAYVYFFNDLLLADT